MFTEQGQVQGGGIVFSRPLPLAEGTRVTVQIQPMVDQSAPSGAATPQDLATLPFFGMWADRDDMADSGEWVRKERARWQGRTRRQD